MLGILRHMFDSSCEKGPLSAAGIAEIFSGCADFERREVLPGLEGGRCLSVCWVDGLADGAAIAEDILRPLTEQARTEGLCERRLLELLERGAGHVTVAESPGGPYTPPLLRAIYEAGGYTELAQTYGFSLNFDCSYGSLEAPQGQRCTRFDVIQPVLEADLLVDIAKLKTHGMMGLSAAVKNLFGCVPGLMKPELHCRFPEREAFGEMVADLCCALKPALCVVDGIVGMEGNGPTGGKPRLVGALAASRDPFALDMVCASLIHQNPVHVPYLRAGMKRGVCPESLDELSLWGVPVQSLAVSDFIQPESCSVNFLDWLPKFLRPLAEKVATPVPKIQTNHCVGCGKCAESCPQHTIRIAGGHAVIDYRKCIRCYCCHEMCPKHVIDIKRFRLFRF